MKPLARNARNARSRRSVRPQLILLVATAGLGAALAAPALAGPTDIGDPDGDGIPNAIDNCSLVGNASQCDTDQDGYGNACDGDFNNNLNVTVTDFTAFFLPDINSGTDSGVGTDMNCNGTVSVTDFGDFFLDQITAGLPGPSGLPCAGNVPCP